jgi:hypothetical protein
MAQLPLLLSTGHPASVAAQLYKLTPLLYMVMMAFPASSDSLMTSSTGMRTFT